MRKLLLVLIAGLTVPAAQASAELAKKYYCNSCHLVDKKLVGPAFSEIAARYKGQPDAAAKLQAKVKAGGSGVWGAMVMPPNNVPEADLKALVSWVLAGAK